MAYRRRSFGRRRGGRGRRRGGMRGKRLRSYTIPRGGGRL